MKTFARITAIVLIVVGLLVVISAIFAGFGAARLGGIPRLGAPRFGFAFGLLVGGALFFQGLTLTALGQGLYLLAEITTTAHDSKPSLVEPHLEEPVS